MRYSFANLMTAQLEPPRMAVEGLLVEGHTAVIVGRFGIGKTNFGLQLSVSLAIARNFLGRRVTRPYKVAYIDAENGASEVKFRLEKQCLENPFSPEEAATLETNWNYVDCEESGLLRRLRFDKQGFKALASFVGDSAAEVLIFDNFGKFFPGSETEEAPIKEFFNGLDMLKNTCPTLSTGLITLLHHPIKPNKDLAGLDLLSQPYEYLSMARGNGRLLDFAPDRLALAQTRFADDEYYVINGIIRGQLAPMILEFNAETFCFSLNGDKDLVVGRVFEGCPRQFELFNALKVRSAFTFTEASKLTDCRGKTFPRQTVTDTLKKAVGNGLFVKNSNGGYRPVGAVD